MDILVSVEVPEGRTKYYLEENDQGDWEIWSTDEDPCNDALLAVVYDEDFAEKILDAIQPRVFGSDDEEDDEGYEYEDDEDLDEEVDEFISHNKKGTWDKE